MEGIYLMQAQAILFTSALFIGLFSIAASYCILRNLMDMGKFICPFGIVTPVISILCFAFVSVMAKAPEIGILFLVIELPP